MKEKLTQYLGTDFYYVEIDVRKETNYYIISELLWYSRQRAFGAVEMARRCGLSPKEAAQIFNEHCRKLEVLKNEMCG